VELVKTKLEPPLNPGELVARPRLQQRLEDAAKVSLTIIQTPAGYGKTSLLSQWFAALRSSSCQKGWLSLDASDRDAVGLLCYIAAALTEGGARFDASIDRVFATETYTAPEPLIAAMVNCFRKTTVPVYSMSASSNTSLARRSRWFVGSSSSRKFAGCSSRRSSA